MIYGFYIHIYKIPISVNVSFNKKVGFNFKTNQKRFKLTNFISKYH